MRFDYESGVHRRLAILRLHATYMQHEPAKVLTSLMDTRDRKSTRLNSSHANISYAVFCLKKNDLLEHDSKKNPVVIPVGTLRPGETRTVTLTLTPRGPGETPIGVTVQADGGLTAKAYQALKV